MYPRASKTISNFYLGGFTMLKSLTLLTLILILPLFACSSVKTGKNIAIDSPLKKSQTNKSLSESRQDVEQTRRVLDSCLASYSGDETKCSREKENYDQAVEEYVSYQTN